MKTSNATRRGSGPVLEVLEGRRMLSAPGSISQVFSGGAPGEGLTWQALGQFAATVADLGGHWAAGGHITYSFPPDGTDVYGVPNDLDAALAARGISTATWHTEVTLAAAAWTEATGISFDLVPDDGSPINQWGPLAGDPRFGDIRIVGIPLSPQELALTFDAPPANWGTSAGDIVLNSTQPWGIDGLDPRMGMLNSADVDLPTVLLHELGHTLGIGELDETTAVQHMTYDGVKRMLTPFDTAQVPARDGGGIGESPSFMVTWKPSHSLGGDRQEWEATLDGPDAVATASAVVDTAGFYLLLPAWTSAGAVRVERTGPDGTAELAPGVVTRMYLTPGVYQFRARADGPGPTSFGFVFYTPSYTLEALLPNGAGQVPAASLRLIGQSSPIDPPSAPEPGVALPTSPTGGAIGGAARPSAMAPASSRMSSAGSFVGLGVPIGRPTTGTDPISPVGPGGDGGPVALAWNGTGLPIGIAYGLDVPRGRRAPNRGNGRVAGPADAPPWLGPPLASLALEDGPPDRAESEDIPLVADQHPPPTESERSLARDIEVLAAAEAADRGAGRDQLAGFGTSVGIGLLSIVIAYYRNRLDAWGNRAKLRSRWAPGRTSRSPTDGAAGARRPG